MCVSVCVLSLLAWFTSSAPMRFLSCASGLCRYWFTVSTRSWGRSSSKPQVPFLSHPSPSHQASHVRALEQLCREGCLSGACRSNCAGKPGFLVLGTIPLLSLLIAPEWHQWWWVHLMLVEGRLKALLCGRDAQVLQQRLVIHLH